MKLVTFTGPDGADRPGAVRDDLASVADLSALAPDVVTLIGPGDGLDRARDLLTSPGTPVLPLDAVRLRAPVPRPPRLRDCSVFEEHMAGGARFAERAGITWLASIPEVWYQQPIYYKGNHLSVIGPDDEIVWPAYAELLDYELEVAAVIGRPGRDLAPGEALAHIAGLVIYNDVSVRNVAFGEMCGHMGPAKAKDFDTGNVLGPWLVTLDELADPYALEMRAHLNGEFMGGGTTADMFHRWDAIVAHASAGETLVTGEVIGSGTVGGGTLVEKGRGLAPGDVIEFTVTGLGTLRNQVVAGNPGAPEKR